MISATASTPRQIVWNPLLAYEAMPFRQTFYPLGFPIEIETNDAGVHAIAAAHWPTLHEIEDAPALKIRIGIMESLSLECPPPPVARAQYHLLTFVADQENFISIDLQAGIAFGWLSSTAMHHEDYFQHYFLEAVIMTLLCSKHVTAVHAACVSFAGRGLLLSGQSGAGKSTLAYACARNSWTYTSDDTCYLLWNRETPSVRANARKFRFRPDASELFPELDGYDLTPRLTGKPSVEIPVSEFPRVDIRTEAQVDAMILLSRHSLPTVELIPLNTEETIHMLEESRFPLPFVRDLQRDSLQRLLGVPAFVLRYRDLDPAMERLRKLAHRL
jgi:hypothetical protein